MIPNFNNQAMQWANFGSNVGQNFGSALRNAQAMQQQQQAMQQKQAFDSQMNPLLIEQANLRNEGLRAGIEQDAQNSQMLQNEDLKKQLSQEAMMLANYDEETGKKIIPSLIEKYKDNPAITEGLTSLYQKKGAEYTKGTLMTLAALTGKGLGEQKQRNLSDPEKNLETMQRLESNLVNAQSSGDSEAITNATKQVENFKRLTNKFGASAQEKQDIKTQGVTDKLNIDRRQGFIDSAIDAADGYGVLKRSVDLLDSVATGGFDAAALRAKQLFGIESADEAELSSNMGKAILAQLKPIFGAAFTEKEGARLEAIEANFGKSTEGNKRLLKEAMKISDRAMRRGLAAAKDQGSDFVVDELERMMLEFEESKAETAPKTKTIAQPQQYTEGMTATGPNGEIITFKNGRWVNQ